MTPKIKAALKCIESRATDQTWMMRVQLIKAGITVAKPIEQAIEELKRRRPRVRHKAEKEQLDQDLVVLREALDEVQLHAQQQADSGRTS